MKPCVTRVLYFRVPPSGPRSTRRIYPLLMSLWSFGREAMSRTSIGFCAASRLAVPRHAVAS